MFKGFEQCEKRDGHRQKVYVDKFSDQLSEKVSQIIEQIRTFCQIMKITALDMFTIPGTSI